MRAAAQDWSCEKAKDLGFARSRNEGKPGDLYETQ